MVDPRTIIRKCYKNGHPDVEHLSRFNHEWTDNPYFRVMIYVLGMLQRGE